MTKPDMITLKYMDLVNIYADLPPCAARARLAQLISKPPVAAQPVVELEPEVCARGDKCVCPDPEPARCNAFKNANAMPRYINGRLF